MPQTPAGFTPGKGIKRMREEMVKVKTGSDDGKGEQGHFMIMS